MTTAPIPRSYADPCGVARALDAVGERWALLVIRELSLGPLRFGQLRRGLPDMSPNVLSQRLRELDDAGVVHRVELPPPAGTTLYELTEQGYALDPVLQALGRWGAARPAITTREMSAVSFLRMLRVMLAPGAPDATYGLDVDGEPFTLTIADGVATVARGADVDAVATVTGGVAALRRLLVERADLKTLEASGELSVDGDRRAARKLASSFRPPGGP